MEAFIPLEVLMMAWRYFQFVIPNDNFFFGFVLTILTEVGWYSAIVTSLTTWSATPPLNNHLVMCWRNYCPSPFCTFSRSYHHIGIIIPKSLCTVSSTVLKEQLWNCRLQFSFSRLVQSFPSFLWRFHKLAYPGLAFRYPPWEASNTNVACHLDRCFLNHFWLIFVHIVETAIYNSWPCACISLSKFWWDPLHRFVGFSNENIPYPTWENCISTVWLRLSRLFL